MIERTQFGLRRVVQGRQASMFGGSHQRANSEEIRDELARGLNVPAIAKKLATNRWNAMNVGDLALPPV